jgi:pimeloyl-ACP methyl ester carboxylesterase
MPNLQVEQVEQVDQVVLLHGLARSDRSMRPLAKRLAEAGFEVTNLDYPSTRMEPDALTALIDEVIEQCCVDETIAVHFVTHSLGGILVRAYLDENRPPNLGRVVMLAPPNKGSEIVDLLGDTWLFEKILGPTATQLGTSEESLPNRIGPPTYELGVIAGNKVLNPIGAWLLSGQHDGTVSTESAKLEGMSSFLVLPENHSFIMNDPEVATEVIYFLRNGKFKADSKQESSHREILNR